MTFSLRPRRLSTEPLMLASVRTRVVSWKEAAEMKESVENEALVMPGTFLGTDGTGTLSDTVRPPPAATVDSNLPGK
jgi:hypothetical protein